MIAVGLVNVLQSIDVELVKTLPAGAKPKVRIAAIQTILATIHLTNRERTLNRLRRENLIIFGSLRWCCRGCAGYWPSICMGAFSDAKVETFTPLTRTDWQRCHLLMPCWFLSLHDVKSCQAWITVGTSKFGQTKSIGLF